MNETEVWIMNSAANYIRKARKTHLLFGEVEIDISDFNNEKEMLNYFKKDNWEVDKN